VAETLKVGRHVALKFLPNKPANNGQAPSRLQREGQGYVLLNHPNIRTIHEIDESDGRTFIAMELLRGRRSDTGSLATRRKSRRCSV
jgi:serine/threonine protein kinase